MFDRANAKMKNRTNENQKTAGTRKQYQAGVPFNKLYISISTIHICFVTTIFAPFLPFSSISAFFSSFRSTRTSVV